MLVLGSCIRNKAPAERASSVSRLSLEGFGGVGEIRRSLVGQSTP